MKRNKDNSFTKKFDLLNSQNHNVDICWSSSESSDYEIIENTINPSTLNKHKKRKRKKVVQSNFSNSSLRFVKPTNENKKVRLDNSPIISKLNLETKQCGEKSSPILSNKVKREVKSPVLLLKQKSSVLSPTIKKKLFVANNQSELNKTEVLNVMTSEELKQSSNDKNEIKTKPVKSVPNNNNYAVTSHVNEIYYSPKNPLIEYENKVDSCKFTNTTVLSTNNNIEEAIDVFKPKTKIDLMKKVQSYFDSQFGSDSASQQSISETETLTQKSDTKSSEDLEITNSLTQNKDSPLTTYKSNSIVSYGSWEVNFNVEKSKKTKYKKDGLAFRLDQLLKKQNANISLWQHEKFLAQNSNFIIPKTEHIVFRIQKINFKYGCYILETVDLSDERYLIFINGYYVNSACNLVPDVVLKLYMPYKILDLNNNYKIVINVCKFECVSIVS